MLLAFIILSLVFARFAFSTVVVLIAFRNIVADVYVERIPGADNWHTGLDVHFLLLPGTDSGHFEEDISDKLLLELSCFPDNQTQVARSCVSAAFVPHLNGDIAPIWIN